MKIKSIIKIIIIPNENKKAIPDHLHIIDFVSKIRGLLAKNHKPTNQPTNQPFHAQIWCL
jgi:hypothetical protein